ncbi:RING-H2 finger protein ATL52-like [Coffea eugenioides]|nr:RING-H2 finger protein ATL52-like [Coffea eugenioides]
MGNSPIPYSPPPTTSNNMPLLYYGMVVVGTAALILAVYNLIILRWCSQSQADRPRQGMAAPLRFEAASASSQSLDSLHVNLISSFKYKKGGSSRDEAHYSQYECAVCLSVYEEDEELRQLPRCKHSFHASCIDMWLYSHLDCPLCRSPVDPPVLNRVLNEPTRRAGQSREGLQISSRIPV